MPLLSILLYTQFNPEPVFRVINSHKMFLWS